jgi:DNA-directed RNA polymerase specialized sigma24 family protein
MAMSSQGSVTRLLQGISNGEPGAASELWTRYAVALVKLARRQLNARYQAVHDPADPAVDAFLTFCRRSADGSLEVNDRDEFYRLLARFIYCKVVDIVERENAQKRSGGIALREAEAHGRQESGGDRHETLDAVEGREPSPEAAAIAADALKCLFDLLPDDQYRRTAELKIEGHTEDEIATQMDCSARTVRRHLDLIRKVWRRKIGDE